MKAALGWLVAVIAWVNVVLELEGKWQTASGLWALVAFLLLWQVHIARTRP